MEIIRYGILFLAITRASIFKDSPTLAMPTNFGEGKPGSDFGLVTAVSESEVQFYIHRS